jgi:hypothetical protein
MHERGEESHRTRISFDGIYAGFIDNIVVVKHASNKEEGHEEGN